MADAHTGHTCDMILTSLRYRQPIASHSIGHVEASVVRVIFVREQWRVVNFSVFAVAVAVASDSGRFVCKIGTAQPLTVDVSVLGEMIDRYSYERP